MNDPTLTLLVTDDPHRAAGDVFPPADDEAGLAALYAHPDPRPGRSTAVRAQMVTTLDGSATGPDGLSGTINGPADHRVFEVTRVVADVVLIGAGTARAEGYTTLTTPPALRGTRRATGRADDLELALVTRSGRVPDALLDADRPPFVLTGAAGATALADRLPRERLITLDEKPGVELDLPVGLDALAERGLTTVVTEGGPHLLRSLLAAGLVDELALTLSPLLTAGDGPEVLRGARLAPPAAARLRSLLRSGSTLLGLWRVDAGHAADPAHLG